jgi:hypothetical protein
MKADDQPQPDILYETTISGTNNTNIIGGVNYHYPKTPIARSTLNQKGTETFVGREDDLVKLHGLLSFGDQRKAVRAGPSGHGYEFE